MEFLLILSLRALTVVRMPFLQFGRTKRTLPGRYHGVSIEIRIKKKPPWKRGRNCEAKKDCDPLPLNSLFSKLATHVGLLFSRRERPRTGKSSSLEKSPWIERENKEIMPDGPRLPLKGSSPPRQWILHQRNADVFALLRALISPLPSSGLHIHCSSLFSPSSTLPPPFSSPRTGIGFLSTRIVHPRALTSLDFHVSVSAWLSPTSPIFHLSMLQ